MYEYNKDVIDSATMLNKSQREINLKWFSDQSEGVFIEAIRLMRKNLANYKSKLSKEMYDELLYSALIVAANKMRIVETSKAHKRSMESEEGRKMTEIRVERIKAEKMKSRISKKRDLINISFAEIDQLRSKGLSWRQIGKYFSKFHRKKISYAYIQQEYNKIRNCRMRRPE